MATVPEASNTIPPVGLDSVASRLYAHAALVAVYLALFALSLLPFVLIEHPFLMLRDRVLGHSATPAIAPPFSAPPLVPAGSYAFSGERDPGPLRAD